MTTMEIRGWASSRETDPEVALAIWNLAGGDPDEAQRIWDDPTDAEQIAIWERVTDNGLRPGADYQWGASTLAEVER